MNIKKVINNNIICADDLKGKEIIAVGKGIGFNKKVGDKVDTDNIRKIYRMTSSAVQQKLMELLEEIPYEHLKLTEELIDIIKEKLSYKLNESLILTLSDHISFAIKRKEDNMEFSNPLLTSIMECYPEEYNLGVVCLDDIKDKLGVELRIDEAGFIAMHIVNAELNTQMKDMYDITGLIDGCVHIVEYYYNKKFDKKSLSFSRFIVHLRYFAQRLFSSDVVYDKALEKDEYFNELIAKNCSEHYKCAKCIEEFILNTYQKELSNEELTYLTIHLKRINSD